MGWMVQASLTGMFFHFGFSRAVQRGACREQSQAGAWQVKCTQACLACFGLPAWLALPHPAGDSADPGILQTAGAKDRATSSK